MKKKFLTLIFTFLLTLTMSAAASANLQPDVQYEYGSQSLEMIETSKGHILLEQVETDYDTWSENHTILRYDADGKELAKLSLGFGQQDFVKHNGKAYIVFLDYTDRDIKLYDEAFKLLNTLPFTNVGVENLQLKSVENELLYFYDTEYNTAFAVSLAELTLTEYELNVKSAYVYSDESGVTLRTFDQFEMPFPNVPVTGNLLESANYSGTQLMNHSVYVASANEDNIEVVKINTGGKVETTTAVTLPVGTAVNSAHLESIIMDEKILYYQSTYEQEQKAIVFVYNTKTDKVEYMDIKQGQPNYQYYGNDKLREYTFGENGAVTFYDTNFNKLYTLDNDLGSLIYPGGDYLIINYDTEAPYRSNLHDLKTGKFIRTLFTSEDLYNPTGVAEALLFDSNTSIYFVTQAASYDLIANDATGYFTQVANKGGSNVIIPIGQVVEPTKTWTVTLTQAVDRATVTNETVVVKNAKGEQIDVTFSIEGKKISITAPENGYATGNYTLTLQGLKSASGKTLKKATTKQFSVQ